MKKFKIKKPDIIVSYRASQEAIDTQLDLEVMLTVAVYEQARYFREIGPALLAAAKRSFINRHRHMPQPYESALTIHGHVQRVSHILAATRVLGRARIVKETGVRPPRQEFSEVLQGVGIQEAVRYLQSLPVATRQEWEELVRAGQGTAFTAAGIENKDALEGLRNLLAQALDKDWTAAQFEDAANALLRTYQTEAGQFRTLWNTLTATAMAVGREEMLNDPEVRKVVSYRLYDAILDLRTRPNHRAFDGGIAPWNWHGWSICKPPNGFNCRCTLIGITDVRARNLLAGGSYFDLTKGIPIGAYRDRGYAEAA